jgi:hypothetical protein
MPITKDLGCIIKMLSQLQGYTSVDICILGTERTNYNFWEIGQGRFTSP